MASNLLSRLGPWTGLSRLQVGSISALKRSFQESGKEISPASGDLKKIDEFTDIETHTGQKFEESDYRLSRFIGGKQKLINPRFAIDLVAEIPPIAVKGRVASCDGGGGPLGHPTVFINLDKEGNHACGYCGLRFFQQHDH